MTYFLAKGFSILICKGFSLGSKSLAKGFLNFNSQGYEYKVDDLIP
jgi:hypothetical protein